MDSEEQSRCQTTDPLPLRSLRKVRQQFRSETLNGAVNILRESLERSYVIPRYKNPRMSLDLIILILSKIKIML